LVRDERKRRGRRTALREGDRKKRGKRGRGVGE